MSELRRREEAIDRLNTHYIQCRYCNGDYYCAVAREMRAKVPDLLRCGKCGLWIEAKGGILPVHALFNIRCDGSGRMPRHEEGDQS